MAAAVDAGQRVVCVSATAGELGTPDPVAWPPDRLGRLRRWETAAAMAILGVRDHRFLGLPDGALASVDPEHGIGIVEALIDDVAPATIVTFAPHGMTFHADHVAVSHWVTEAWRRTGCAATLLHAVPEEAHAAAFAEDYERWGVFMTDERPSHDPRQRPGRAPAAQRVCPRPQAGRPPRDGVADPAGRRRARRRPLRRGGIRGGVRRCAGLTTATRTVRRERPDRATPDGQDGVRPRGRSRRPRGGPSTPACRPPCPRRCARRGAPGRCA